MASEKIVTFREDQESSEKGKGGGVMLVIPKNLKAKARRAVNHTNEEVLQSVWVEFNLIGNSSRRDQLVNLS